MKSYHSLNLDHTTEDQHRLPLPQSGKDKPYKEEPRQLLRKLKEQCLGLTYNTQSQCRFFKGMRYKT